MFREEFFDGGRVLWLERTMSWEELAGGQMYAHNIMEGVSF
jgi:hypothetical protein